MAVGWLLQIVTSCYAIRGMLLNRNSRLLCLCNNIGRHCGWQRYGGRLAAGRAWLSGHHNNVRSAAAEPAALPKVEPPCVVTTDAACGRITETSGRTSRLQARLVIATNQKIFFTVAGHCSEVSSALSILSMISDNVAVWMLIGPRLPTSRRVTNRWCLWGCRHGPQAAVTAGSGSLVGAPSRQ
jgi:hypothetical protein